ncbi:MAG: hypothetical protein GF307_08600 [candidate division Zixibacteria bacterium]|nr:hypothetical protein [candidate division Zixibacteria bacterium]
MSDKMMNKRNDMPDYAPATENHADGGRFNKESGSMNNPMPFFMPTEEYNYSFLNSFMKYGLGATPWG